MTQRDTKETFILKTLSVPEILGRYSYVDTIYVDSRTKIDITCPDHGNFHMLPRTHLSGKGCPSCGRLSTRNKKLKSKEDFIEKSFLVQEGRYNYDCVNYKDRNTKVEIICEAHGVFWQVPKNHIRGEGCPSCTQNGFRKIKAGYLYILSDGITTKVGITNRKPQVRVQEVVKSGGPNLSVVSEFYFASGQYVYDLEKVCHEWLTQNYLGVDATYNGYTECFLNVDIPKLLTFVTQLLPPEAT